MTQVAGSSKTSENNKGSHTTMPFSWRVGLPWPIGPKVEDPIRIKELTDSLALLKWDSKSTRLSLEAIFSELSRLTHAEIRYYYNKRKAAGFLAAVFRFNAWILGAIGALIPIALPLFEKPPAAFLSWGYFAIALAGVFVVADTVFLGTEGQARAVTAQLKLEHIYTNFSLEWQALLVAYDSEPSPLNAVSALERVILFMEKLYESLASETSEWKATLKTVREEIVRQTLPSNGKQGQPVGNESN